MKAAVMTRFSSPLEMQEVPEPKVGDNDVLVKVAICGVCYSDVKIWAGKSAIPPALPHILGHEIAGTVTSFGKNVEGLEIGENVIVYLYDTCGECRFCRKGKDNRCINMGPLLGFTRQGGFSEYVSIPSKNIFKIPKQIDLETAALLPDAIITPYHAIVDRAKVRFNETVMVLGIGGLALGGIQVLKLMGAHVIAVSRTRRKLEMSSKFGADIAIESTEDLPAKVKKATEGYGVDCAIDFVSNSTTIDQCIRSMKKGGRTVLMGYNAEPTAINTAVLMNAVGSIISTRGGTRQNLRDIIQLAAEGKIKSVVTEAQPLEKANDVLNRLSIGEILGRAALKLGN